MMMKFSVLFGLSAAADLAAAGAVARQASPTTCSNTVSSILDSSDPGIDCLAPGGLEFIISLAKSGQNDQLPVNVDLWLYDFCDVGACSNQTLGNVAGNISTACGSTFGNITLGNAADFATVLKNDYPVIRDMMCLANTANDGFKFCMTQMFSGKVVTALQTTDPVQVITALVDQAFNSDCNECTKAAYQLFNPIFPQMNGTGLITQACGPAFAATLNISAVDIRQNAAPGVFSEKSNKGRVVAGSTPTVAALLLAVAAVLTLV
ncbi:hypothetical protein C8R44DRAFT_790631 [Mycena epipterygia]|nr:hypothetical protein C8R44DRAFT_790631 [Mycena epipterygia]